MLSYKRYPPSVLEVETFVRNDSAFIWDGSEIPTQDTGFFHRTFLERYDFSLAYAKRVLEYRQSILDMEQFRVKHKEDKKQKKRFIKIQGIRSLIEDKSTTKEERDTAKKILKKLEKLKASAPVKPRVSLLEIFVNNVDVLADSNTCIFDSVVGKLLGVYVETPEIANDILVNALRFARESESVPKRLPE